MPSAARRADAVWEGDLAKGSGKVSASSSKAFNQLAVTWAARTEGPEGKTSPEELVAAAHASCFSMAFSARLGRAGTPPTKLETSATVTFEQKDGGWSVVSSALEVVGEVPGLDQEKFAAEAEEAKNGCPISRALKGNVELSVKATLKS
jgi:osmotically inducible protein OsmC